MMGEDCDIFDDYEFQKIFIIDNRTSNLGCPIRVDILPKQVGQSITTPIVSHQTATITSTGNFRLIFQYSMINDSLP